METGRPARRHRRGTPGTGFPRCCRTYGILAGHGLRQAASPQRLLTVASPADAELFYRESLEGMRRVQGDAHPHTLFAIHNLGQILEDQGKLNEAEPLYREALDSHRRVRDDEHPDTLGMIGNMGTLLQAQGKLNEAEHLLREALEGKRRVLGHDHPSKLASADTLGAQLQAQGKLTEAEPLFREAVEVSRRVLGDDHPDTLSSISAMGLLLRGQARLPEAEPFHREAFEGSRRLRGDAHPDTLVALASLNRLLDERIAAARNAGDGEALGELLASVGAFRLTLDDDVGAEPLLAEAVELFFAMLPESDARPWRVLSDLGASIAGQGRTSEAEHLLLESAEWMLANAPAPSAMADEGHAQADVTTPATVVQRVVDFYEAWHATEPTGGFRASAERWRERQREWRAASSEQRDG